MRRARFRLLRHGGIVRLRGGPLRGRASPAASVCCCRRSAAAATDTLIVTDGFSCREMIRQETTAAPLHFAQVLQMAIHEGPDGPAGSYPEARYAALERTPAVPMSIVAGVGIAAGLWWMRSRRGRA